MINLVARVKNIPHVISKYRYHCGASILLFFWVLPYISSGSKIEWGDFSFFAQAYEAMRVSIVHYHEFPWFNPWVSGGVPLYGNPQMGVFSIQMLLVILFGAPLGLKIALAIYSVLGYCSMYFFLTRYFKISRLPATLLSLLWVFCSFFVAHLPSHFTFAWYLLAPAYFHLALVFKNWRGGFVFGSAFAIMALSQLHNPFIHISFICTIIVLFRLVLEKTNRKFIIKGIGTALLTFLVMAGHRILFTYQNLHDFQHVAKDPAASISTALKGPLFPLSFTHPFQFITYPQPPIAPYGFAEISATIGIFALFAVFTALCYMIYQVRINRSKANKQFVIAYIMLAVIVACGSLALGHFSRISPYNVLKHLPVFSQMRVSTRWFIFFDAGLLIYIGLIMKGIARRTFAYTFMMTLLGCGVLEMFTLGVGYQARILSRAINVPSVGSWHYGFEETSYFGEANHFAGGQNIPYDGNMPHAYREYEATRWNLGILYANDAQVQLALDPRYQPGKAHPTCPAEQGCPFVLSSNATLTYWSPDKIILKRIAPGDIMLNMNDSDYFVINGKRENTSLVVMPFSDFTIKQPDSVRTITIQAKPSITKTIKSLHNKTEVVTLN